MKTRTILRNTLPTILCLFLLQGCAWLDFGSSGVDARKHPAPVTQAHAPQPSVKQKALSTDTTWTVRPFTNDELYELEKDDPDLTPAAGKDILARLNAKAPYHVADDIQKGRPMKVPNSFAAYKEWCPLPSSLKGPVAGRKLIIIVKDLPYIGWYEGGKLVGNTYACIGREGEETRLGNFAVLEKDDDHYSRSYSNSYGKPAWMPWALRIYETVWIHAGDITQAKCSHGCIILPIEEAQDLFSWADMGTPVLVVDSTTHLPRS